MQPVNLYTWTSLGGLFLPWKTEPDSKPELQEIYTSQIGTLIDEWRTTISWFLESWDGRASFINRFRLKLKQHSACVISDDCDWLTESHYFYCHFWVNFGVLQWVWKPWFIAFRIILHYVNVASIGPAIAFWRFDAWAQNLIIFTAISWPMLAFFGGSESYDLYLSGPSFSV